MRRILFSTITIILLLANLSTAEDNGVWTLERCIEQAVANSNLLVQGELNIQKADAERREIAAEKRGIVEFTSTAGHVSEVMEMELNLPIPGATAQKIKFGNGNTIDMQVVGKIPLYTGGALAAKKLSSQFNVNAFEHQSAIDTLDLIFQVEAACWLAAGAILRESTLQQSRLRLERHKAELDSSVIRGVGTREMILGVEARILQVKTSLSTALAEVETAKLNLGAAVGKPGVMITPELELPVAHKEDRQSPPLPMVDANRPEFQTIDARLAQTKAASRIVQASYLPSVGLILAYHYAKPGINQVANDWMSYYNAGLNLSWTIWDWGVRDRRVDKALLVERELNLRRKDAEEKLQNRCETSYRRLMAAELAVEFAAKRVQVEKERQALLQVRHRLGAASVSELLDGEDDFTLAETALVEVQVKFQMADAEYKRALAR